MFRIMPRETCDWYGVSVGRFGFGVLVGRPARDYSRKGTDPLRSIR